jgi:hypothetical protein
MVSRPFLKEMAIAVAPDADLAAYRRSLATSRLPLITGSGAVAAAKLPLEVEEALVPFKSF